ncbi:transcriptional regulator [Sphaerospermopsis sp. LEGE 00249]|uniref:helix-turn-helix domain-containing protein n=1 Tax=Sphaerospermopsis sp. LEGE 00249 TaxID=1380707 RepID=UPI00164D9614|nr:transcriptional regulator [Sphaerospermopsis sp. LEGE 00249]MBC5795083.1 transcriptional regulator [Sphaerospermopsis sp. LEGE 00249]
MGKDINYAIDRNEYQSALQEVERLFFNKNRTTEEDALYDLLVMLVEKYETENHPLEPAKPLQVLQHLMEERGMNEADLLNILGLKEGDQEIVNAILKGDCNINAEQAEVLGKYFYVPSKLFV